MAGTLELDLTLTLTGTYIDPDSIGPRRVELTLAGYVLRRTADLTVGNYTTLDPADITPVVWYFQNVDDTNNLVVGFGEVDILTLPPGHWNLVSSALTPYATAVGGASRILYAVYA